MIYQQLHRRLWLDGLNAAMGLGLEPPAIPPATADPHWHGWYDDILASLRTITPRIADPLASQWTRGVARAVKYPQRIDVDGRQFVDLELDVEPRAEISEAASAKITGKYSGRAPAITAFTATFSTVYSHSTRNSTGCIFPTIFIVILGFLVDLGSYGGSDRARRQRSAGY